MADRNALIRMARQLLQAVLSQLGQQLNAVNDDALTPIRQIVQTVTGGAWRGEAANAFVDEASSLVIPGIGKVGEDIANTSRNIEAAMNIVDKTDNDLSGEGNRLGDLFDGIYR